MGGGKKRAASTGFQMGEALTGERVRAKGGKGKTTKSSRRWQLSEDGPDDANVRNGNGGTRERELRQESFIRGAVTKEGTGLGGARKKQFFGTKVERIS